MTVQSEFLKSTAYFSGMEPAGLDFVKKFILEKKVERGEMILVEGEPAEILYFVVAGAVKVFKTSAEGKEQILQIIRPGESFNDVPVYGGDVNLVSARSMGPVVLNMLKKADLKAIMDAQPAAAMNTIKVLSLRVRQMVSIVEDLSFRNVTGRVARILLEYAVDKNDGERPKLTQQEMAAMIGTAREMVGRSLKNLADDGTIRMEGHRVVISDEKALREIAGVD
jgi:CRP-like cAMP-binding protein